MQSTNFNPSENSLLNQNFWIQNLKNDVEKTELISHVLSDNQLLINRAVIELKNKSELDKKFTDYDVSALAIAVLGGNYRSVKKLIKAGADINCRDRYLWTPIHYATLLPSERIFNLLVRKGADGSACTGLDLTTQDLQKLIGKQEAILNPNVTIQVEGHNIPSTEIKNSPIFRSAFPDFKEYTDELRYNREDFLALWTRKIPEDPQADLLSSFIVTYEEGLRNPPPLCVKADEALKGRPCYGLFAETLIKRGCFIVEYTGQYKNSETPADLSEIFIDKPEYGHNTFDALEVGNASRWANEGFPNCALVPVYNSKGGERVILVATEDIKPGEEILWDYRNVLCLKWGKYALQNPKRLVKFFTSHSFNKIKKMIKEAEENITPFCSEPSEEQDDAYHLRKVDAVCQLLDIQLKITYSLMTPTVLIFLTCKELVATGEWLKLMNESWVSSFLRSSPYPHEKFINKTVFTLELLMETLVKVNPGFKFIALQFVLGQIGKLTVMQLIKTLISLYDFFNDNMDLFSVDPMCFKEKWVEFKRNLLEKELPNFQSEEDSFFPLKLYDEMEESEIDGHD